MITNYVCLYRFDIMECIYANHGIPIWGDRFISSIVRLGCSNPYRAIDNMFAGMLFIINTEEAFSL